jgi:predicted dehydrogenase
VVIATPAASHFSLARQVLDAGKHVFVEKPLATKVKEVDELARLAAERSRVVMAATPSCITQLSVTPETDRLRRARRAPLYLQSAPESWAHSFHIDALWNFAPHDISIIQYWLGDPVDSVGRQGMATCRRNRRCLP